MERVAKAAPERFPEVHQILSQAIRGSKMDATPLLPNFARTEGETEEGMKYLNTFPKPGIEVVRIVAEQLLNSEHKAPDAAMTFVDRARGVRSAGN